ncbi:hypothetical protein CDL12_29522 [Handroanthus impetiginosus]|uniref:Uncharacterized protein n=1 Tax=Handroanthus impetiginosus TaxID=429701 RepID=A0A2G9FZB7_9LAMI|nr:hypothetical protein CDL12_29522 [Handroanthus impetiginosus]
MVVEVAKVGFHLHPHPSPNPRTFLLLHTQNPPCHFHCRPTSIPNNRFLLLVSPWPLHHIPRSRQYLDSNAESYKTNNFNFDEGEEFDESTKKWDDVLDDYIDSIWILKVISSLSFSIF